MKKRLLAGLSAREFMRRHWQKEPLLARNALAEYASEYASECAIECAGEYASECAAGRPAAGAGITRDELFALASRDDVESRIIVKSERKWSVQHGPFTRRDVSRLPARNWTLLVQGVDQSLWQAARLLREFSFVPYARLDDVMVSYAAPGGGVGPHFDSYDVFLLQGLGKRRWRIGRQSDLELVPDTPVKILARFAPDREYIVQPGDLLYLPPHYAHDGVALDECITYSIGFRAPAAQELANGFVDFLQDRIELDGRYTDAGTAPTRAPGRMPRALVDYAEAVLDRVRWSRTDVERFVGAYLTEPKAHVVFDPPRRPLASAAFAQHARSRGVRLALPTRMLVARGDVYINGERHETPRAARKALAALADARELSPRFGGGAALAPLLYAWYEAGYIELSPS